MKGKEFLIGFLEWLLACPYEEQEEFNERLIEAGYLATFYLATAFIALLMCKIIFAL